MYITYRAQVQRPTNKNISTPPPSHPPPPGYDVHKATHTVRRQHSKSLLHGQSQGAAPNPQSHLNPRHRASDIHEATHTVRGSIPSHCCMVGAHVTMACDRMRMPHGAMRSHAMPRSAAAALSSSAVADRATARCTARADLRVKWRASGSGVLFWSVKW